MLRKRAFLGVLLFAWVPFIVRAVQIYVTANYPQVASILGADGRDVPRLPRAAGLLRLHRDDLRRRRADRQRPARQRAADLPVEAADADGVHRRQGGGAVRLPAARDLGPGAAAAVPAGDVRGQLRLPAEEPVPLPGDHGRLLPAGAARDVHDAGAVVAVEEQPLRRHPLRRHHLLHRRRSTARCSRSPATRRCRGSRSART